MEYGLVSFINSYTQDISGGDACFIEYTKRRKIEGQLIVTSLLGSQLCKAAGIEAEYFLTTHEKRFRNVILTYIRRIIKAFFLKLGRSKKYILYVSSDFLPDVMPACLAKIKNKNNKLVQKIFHLIPPQRFISSFAQKISFFMIKKYADLIITDNYQLAEYLKRKGFNENKIRVNYPGIDRGYFSGIEAQNNAFCYECSFLGRLHPSKGISDLVDIWKEVCAVLSGAKLVIIGGGDQKNLYEKAKEKNIDKNIEIKGFLPRNDVFKIIKSSKIFIFPSHEEGFGMAILEAFACGKPVVAWDLPVYREVFPKGIVRIKQWDIKDFSKAVIKLLSEFDNRNILEKQALEVSALYDWDIIAAKEAKFIEEAAANNS